MWNDVDRGKELGEGVVQYQFVCDRVRAYQMVCLTICVIFNHQ
jgi:hypothetical protein